jgi:hypothetical protein
MDFLSSHYECNFVMSDDHFQSSPVGATANPPKSDDWKWSTDKGAFIKMKNGSGSNRVY